VFGQHREPDPEQAEAKGGAAAATATADDGVEGGSEQRADPDGCYWGPQCSKD